MPYGLKNVGATYQRLVTKMFRPLLGNIMEVYIDDMLVKSKQRPDHATHLQQAFDLLREYSMKLNPLKCAFGVSAGRFLGFMVTQRGIEVNPTQLKAILQSSAPSSKKDIQQLTGWLAALGRFISRFTDRLKPFFTTLRGASRVEWNEECDRAFVAIKQYLIEPLILVSPEAEDTLYLYLAASDIAVDAALFKECGDAKLRPVFFVNKSLTDAETRYTVMPGSDPTRLAGPNLVRGARLYTGTLIDLFFQRAELVPVGIQIISVITKIIYIYKKTTT